MQGKSQYQSALLDNTMFYPLTQRNIVAFQRHIYHYYHQYRRSFPWRDTTDPYLILVSEYMLQQTQTHRVIEKYEMFIQAFPDFASLADAPMAKVLQYWSGLGYNRRAVYLKRCAELVHKLYGDTLPSSEEALQQIPGIGPYTAAAVVAFAFNKPAILIETNIRAVYIHFFFHNKRGIDDIDLRPIIQRTIDLENPREWYYALMDYGVMVKKQFKNPSRNSRHYSRQPPFEGSRRQIRGTIIRLLLTKSSATVDELSTTLRISHEKLKPILMQLEKEQIIVKEESIYHIGTK